MTNDTSKSTWTIRELAENEYPDTQLRYAVQDAEGEVVSLHHYEEDARLMASVPVMMRVLLEMQQKIRTVLTTLEDDK